jgi:serine/threonine-protein kinase
MAPSKGSEPPNSGLPPDDERPSRSSGTKADPLIGKTIAGRFTVLDIIARGGMGKVYRAVQEPLDRICALKVLHPKYDGEEDPEFQKRFFLEAATAAKFSHPNTVTIFDYGRDGDIYFIAMEYVRGRTLYRALREEGPFSEKRVAFIVRQVARSLREAHALGVIHRDMKPANIVLVETSDEGDAVKVLDFGLVKDVTKEQGEDLTEQGLFMGSPKYMAPEQILGNPVSPATDVYSLGIVAYELLTGQVPFDKGTSVKTLMAHVNEPVPRLAGVNPSVQISAAMEGVVLRCLRKNPAERYANIDELLGALSEVEGGAGALTDSRHAMRVVEPPSMPGRIAPKESGTFPQTREPEPVPSDPEADAHPTQVRSRSDAAPASFYPSATPAPMEHAMLELEMPRKSRRGLVLVGVALVAAVGAAVVLGTRKEAAPAAESVPTATTEPTAAAPARTVRVTSTPPGARVEEAGKLVCDATPCEVRWEGDAAGAAHKLTLTKEGLESQEIEVLASDTAVNAELRGEAPRPSAEARRTVRPGPRPVVKAPAPASSGAKAPEGYKDSPY